MACVLRARSIPPTFYIILLCTCHERTPSGPSKSVRTLQVAAHQWTFFIVNTAFSVASLGDLYRSFRNKIILNPTVREDRPGVR